MTANSSYVLQQQNENDTSLTNGGSYLIRTGEIGVPLPERSSGPVRQETLGADRDVVLTALLGSTNKPVATDLAGEVIWYYQGPGKPDGASILLRSLPGGRMLVLDSGAGLPIQVLREIDLAGNVIRETNPFAVNLQLETRHEDVIREFHHDAIRLPNGYTAVLGHIERDLTDVQGPGEVAVVGDLIIVLDENWQVAWTWNSFDFLDPSQPAVLDEKCYNDGRGGCVTVTAEIGNDWLHTNSLDYVEDDGSLILSIRHLDWIAKIDYRDGEGSGDIIWRLGKDGDFMVDSNESWPWFSHTHDASLADGVLVAFDNGNTRYADDAEANSRGQAWSLDESARRASLVLNADLGHYSGFLGSAQRLPNGNYHFLSGAVPDANGIPSLSQSIEILANGQISHILQWESLAYRSFRMESIYAGSE